MKAFFIYSLLGGGWTVIQQRVDAYVSFERKWVDYKHGFGSFAGSFWFGNDRIHNLTKSSSNNTILLDMVDSTGKNYQPAYADFRVQNENTGYTLLVGAGLLDLGLGNFSLVQSDFPFHSGAKFSTIDVTSYSSKCFEYNFGNGGWWHKSCYPRINFNGRFRADHHRDGIYCYNIFVTSS